MGSTVEAKLTGRASRQRREHWKQDTPREQMVALTQAIQGWAVCRDVGEWTPERIQRALKSIEERCDDLFELSKWMKGQWHDAP